MKDYASGSAAAWSAYSGQITSVAVGSGITSVGAYALSGIGGIDTVRLPESVQTVGASAFLGCTGLRAVLVSKALLSVGANALSGCTSLTDIYYSGTEAEWTAVTKGTDDGTLAAASVHFDYSCEIMDITEVILSIGEVSYTPECWAKINLAMERYEAVPDELKPQVTEYPLLTAAYQTFLDMDAAAEQTLVVVCSRYAGREDPVATLQGGGSYGTVLRTAVVLEAPETVGDLRFWGWFLNYSAENGGILLSASNILQYDAEGDVTLTAVYLPAEDAASEITVTAEKYKISRAKGEQTGTNTYSYCPGKKVTVTYTDTDRELLYWLNQDAQVVGRWRRGVLMVGTNNSRLTAVTAPKGFKAENKYALVYFLNRDGSVYTYRVLTSEEEFELPEGPEDDSFTGWDMDAEAIRDAIEAGDVVYVRQAE